MCHLSIRNLKILDRLTFKDLSIVTLDSAGMFLRSVQKTRSHEGLSFGHSQTFVRIPDDCPSPDVAVSNVEDML